MSKQPRDDGNDPIPVLSYRVGAGQQLYFDFNDSYRSTAFSPSVRVISVYSTGAGFFEIGDETVTANSTTSHYLPAGIYIDISLGSDIVARDNYKYIAITSLDNEGTLYISERE